MVNLTDVSPTGRPPELPRPEPLFRLAQRVEALSGECEECKNFRAEIHRLGLLAVQSGPYGFERKEYEGSLARVTNHLYRKHRLVFEHHYIKRFVSMAAVLGVGLIGLGYVLFIIGVTVIVLAVAVPALFGRLAVGYLAGLYLDRRAKKRGAVI